MNMAAVQGHKSGSSVFCSPNIYKETDKRCELWWRVAGGRAVLGVTAEWNGQPLYCRYVYKILLKIKEEEDTDIHLSKYMQLWEYCKQIRILWP